MFAERMSEEVTKKQGAKILEEVTEEVTNDYIEKVTKSLRKKLESQFKNDNPEASNDEITAMVDEVLTDAYVEEHFTDYYSWEEVDEMINETYLYELESAIEDAIYEISDSPEYDREFEKLRNSDEYKKRLEDVLAFDAPSKIIARVDEYIAKLLTPYTDNMIAEMNTEIENAINAFIEEYSEYLGLTREEMLCNMGYLELPAATEDEETEDSEESTTEGEEGEEPVIEYVQPYTSWYEFVFKVKLEKVYKAIYPDKKA